MEGWTRVLQEGAVMVRTVWPRVVLVVLVLSLFALPASAAFRATRAKVEKRLDVFASIWLTVVRLLPQLNKLGPGMDPMGKKGTTPPMPPSSGADLGPGMDPLV